uniref:Uncharacterized protein n=1 Tax=Rhizophora mucronata TaxID=61149 RepID=A0A2P2Q5W1_RHIMU
MKYSWFSQNYAVSGIACFRCKNYWKALMKLILECCCMYYSFSSKLQLTPQVQRYKLISLYYI